MTAEPLTTIGVCVTHLILPVDSDIYLETKSPQYKSKCQNDALNAPDCYISHMDFEYLIKHIAIKHCGL